MHMKKFILIFLPSMIAASPCFASEAPLIGTSPADAHQVCGKKITLEIKTLSDKTQIIGLMNNTTNKLDLFQSTHPVDTSTQYAKFVPTKFDGLSKDFIPQNDDTIEIIWGAAAHDNQQIVYSLSLGSHVYNCGMIQKWPNEKANTLYGEVR